MTILVAELADRRTAEREELLARYRDAVWQAARGEADVDVLDAASRPLNLNPAQIGGNVATVEAWIKANKDYERYKEMNVDKEHGKAKARLEKCTDALRVARADEARATPTSLGEKTRTVGRRADDLLKARERDAHWVRQADGQASTLATMQRVERANPDLFRGHANA